MVNANKNTPASNNRKKYMDVFGGKSAKSSSGAGSADNDRQKTTPSPAPTVEKRVIDKPPVIDKPQNLSLKEKVGGSKIGGSDEIKNPKATRPIKKTKKIFGLDVRSVTSVAAIALFFMLSMAGVLIALQQRMNPDEVAVPTAPKSKPAAAETVVRNCSLSFVVTEPSPTPSVSPTPSPTPSVSPSPSPSVSPSPTPSVSPSPSPSPITYSCDSECESNEQCESANTDYICYQNNCRLDSNPSSSECETKANEYACNSGCDTNEQCQSASSSYICYQNNCRLDSNPGAENCQPTTYVYTPPVIGCNDSCVSNGDCSNSEHICYNSACRLATNPTSGTCSVAQTTTYQAPKGEQPTLPAALPESGSDSILDWLKAGIGVMGIGAVLLLLL